MCVCASVLLCECAVYLCQGCAHKINYFVSSRQTHSGNCHVQYDYIIFTASQRAAIRTAATATKITATPTCFQCQDKQTDRRTERQSKLQLNANAVINFRSGFDDDDEQDEAMAMAKASPARHLNGKSLPGWLWKLVAARNLDSLQ